MINTKTKKRIKKVLTTTFFTLSLVAPEANANVLSLEPSGKTIENVAISKSASAAVGGRQYALTTVGSGVRAKKIAIVNIKVYVGQLLVADPTHFARTMDGALDSVGAMKSAAIRLDFLRTVEAQTVQSSFKDSLMANQVDLNLPALHEFLDTVASGGDATQGKALTLIGEKLTESTDAVTYEDTAGKVTTITGPTGFMRDIFSIWLGRPADGGVENLKKLLISGN